MKKDFASSASGRWDGRRCIFVKKRLVVVIDNGIICYNIVKKLQFIVFYKFLTVYMLNAILNLANKIILKQNVA